jgi:hypothetical protein
MRVGQDRGTPTAADGVPTAEPPLAGDGEQPTLLRRCGCSPRLKRSVRRQSSSAVMQVSGKLRAARRCVACGEAALSITISTRVR